MVSPGLPRRRETTLFTPRSILGLTKVFHSHDLLGACDPWRERQGMSSQIKRTTYLNEPQEGEPSSDGSQSDARSASPKH